MPQHRPARRRVLVALIAALAWLVAAPGALAQALVDPPDTVIDSPASGTRVNASTPIVFRAVGDGGGGFVCTVVGSGDLGCDSPISAGAFGLSDGPFELRIAAIASDGVTVDPTPATVSLVLDVTAPQTTIVTAPPARSPSGEARLTFSADEPVAGYRCAVDGGPLNPCGAELALSGLADGAHQVLVRAFDVAGNPDPTPAVVTWSSDATPPDTRIDAGPFGRLTDPTARFSYSSPDDPAPWFECAVDGGAFSACAASGLTLTGVGVGDHVFAVRAVDGFGRPDPSPATRAWSVGSAPAAPVRATCASRRVLTVTLGSRRTPVRGVVATIDGVRVAATGRAPARVRVDLRGRPPGVAVVRVRGRTADGRLLRTTRTFATCGPAAG
ncbi:hypothetical protein [Paraconexibacter algicola]|uniref:Ig-like domain-containing protein n=1 Tax=Paraconexibacter algicola TaxID=2133960 RepID=A0A2T4UI16_9ACTN|nr:hypothetical protein [Paraconexibacter algicola]PTL58868.1 hypothetical protein C7Y72_03980 [Paraconexibacter algicola]